MYTKREASEKLGIDRKTLDKWLEASGIEPSRDGRDGRLRVLSEDDVRMIRERYADRHTFSASFTHRPQTVHTSAADLDELRAQVAALQQQLAALLATRHNPNLTAQPQRHDDELPPRQIVTTVRYGTNPARPPVPPHLMSLPTWAERHGVNPSTMKTWREKGKLPVERGQWLEERNGHITRIDTALTIEGRQIAHQLAGILWPCEICATVEDNETPHMSDM